MILTLFRMGYFGAAHGWGEMGGGGGGPGQKAVSRNTVILK